MARYFIDLGMFPGSYHYSTYGLVDYTGGIGFAYKEFRDKIRAILDPVSDGLTFSVSDILRWQGINANNFGWMFQIIHKDGAGNPTGHVWTWFSALPTAGDSSPELGKVMMSDNSTTWASYFTRCNNNQSFLNDDFSPVILYTPDYTRQGRFTGAESSSPTLGTWQLQGDASINGVILADNGGGDWTVRLDAGRRLRAGDVIEDSMSETLTIAGVTYDHCYDTGFDNHNTGLSSSGDWLDAPIKNPYSDWSNFMFASPLYPQLYGINFESSYGINDRSTPYNIAIVADDAEPFLSFMVLTYDRPLISSFSILGDIIDPAKAGDTFTKAVLYGYADISTSSSYTVFGIFCDFIYGDHPSGTPASARASGTVRYVPNRQTVVNERNSAGEYVQDILTLDDANEIKGKIKESVCRVYGAPGFSAGAVVTEGSNCFVRAAYPIGLPFVVGQAQWPSGIRYQNKSSRAYLSPT